MLIETLSVFPEMFEPVMSTSILGRARKAGLFLILRRITCATGRTTAIVPSMTSRTAAGRACS